MCFLSRTYPNWQDGWPQTITSLFISKQRDDCSYDESLKSLFDIPEAHEWYNMRGRDITSNIKLFTGSTLLNGQVHNSDNAISLKSNLDKLVQWETLWQIILSSTCWNGTFYEFAEPRILWFIPTLCLAKPCHSLWTTNLILELIYQIYYDLNWTTHILNIRNKAYLALCQEELIYHCPHLVKDQAYKITSETNVGNYSYGSTVWGLYSAYQKSWLGQVQHRAACFITRT